MSARPGRPQGGLKSEMGKASYWRMNYERLKGHRMTNEKDGLHAIWREAAEKDAYHEVWTDDPAPGGYLCSQCLMPVESEPCPTHAPGGSDA